MKYISTGIAILVLMACNLTTPSTAPAVSPATATSTPLAINETLSITPIEGLNDDGSLILTPQTNVTVTWDGLPDGSIATFILEDFLSDGGVMEIGQGTSASFTVFDRLDGSISAFVNLPDGTTFHALSVPVLTGNMIFGDCQYIPPALGPGVTLYSEANLNSTNIGTVIYDAEYHVLATQNGVDDKGAAIPFYQIEQVGTGSSAWVRGNVGENLAGDCSALQ